MLLASIFLLVGFILLIKGADFLVDGAASMAKGMGISSLVIGLTVVAFGTSAPEFVVNLISSFNGKTDLAVGNILGSNIANTLLILGVAALIYPIDVKESTIWKELPFSLLAVVVLFVVANDIMLDGAISSQLTRSEGLSMLLFFVIFTVYIYEMAKQGKVDNGLDGPIEERPPWINGSLIVIGLIGLTIGGKWIVDGAVFFAEHFGMSEAFIGLTVVAIGTSLPELATASMAAYRKHPDMVVGGVIGSNIFNILWVLALSSSIRPLPFSEDLNQDITVVVLVTFLLFLAMLRGGAPNKIVRWEGASFIFLYVVYVGYLFVRG